MKKLDPRRSDVHVRPDLSRNGAAGRRALSLDEIRRWTPVVRRHAMRIADRCGFAIGVAELTEVGVAGLIEAVALAARADHGLESDHDLELAVVGAMQSHLLARRAAQDAARRQSVAVARAIGALGPPDVALRAARSTIVDKLGWTVHEYERVLLSIAQAGLAPVEVPHLAAGAAPDGAAMPFAEALAGLSCDDRALIALVYVDALDLPTAAVRLGRSPREVTVDHVEIVHRLLVALARR